MTENESQFISEPIRPDPGTFESAALARGEPGLPTGFRWRDEHFEIAECLDSWKESVADNHSPGGERYYRKRFFRVRVTRASSSSTSSTTASNLGEATMTLYCLRHTGPSKAAQKKRWWLYTID